MFLMKRNSTATLCPQLLLLFPVLSLAVQHGNLLFQKTSCVAGQLVVNDLTDFSKNNWKY